MLLWAATFGVLLGCSLADNILYIDELEDLVTGSDKRLLDQLDDDKYTPR